MADSNVIPFSSSTDNSGNSNESTPNQAVQARSDDKRTCHKCSKDFDSLRASGDPRYCVECGSDFTVIDEIKKTVVEDYDEFRDILNKFTQKFRQVTLQGEFWKFNTRAIHSLSDASLSAWIEYHRGMVVLLEQETTERKVKNIQIQLHSPAATTTSRKVTETVVKKTTRVKRDPMAAMTDLLGNLDPAQAASLLAALMKKSGK